MTTIQAKTLVTRQHLRQRPSCQHGAHSKPKQGFNLAFAGDGDGDPIEMALSVSDSKSGGADGSVSVLTDAGRTGMDPEALAAGA